MAARRGWRGDPLRGEPLVPAARPEAPPQVAPSRANLAAPPRLPTQAAPRTEGARQDDQHRTLTSRLLSESWLALGSSLVGEERGPSGGPTLGARDDGSGRRLARRSARGTFLAKVRLESAPFDAAGGRPPLLASGRPDSRWPRGMALGVPHGETRLKRRGGEGRPYGHLEGRAPGANLERPSSRADFAERGAGSPRLLASPSVGPVGRPSPPRRTAALPLIASQNLAKGGPGRSRVR